MSAVIIILVMSDPIFDSALKQSIIDFVLVNKHGGGWEMLDFPETFSNFSVGEGGSLNTRTKY